MESLALVVCSALLFLDAVNGHGKLQDPPPRNAVLNEQRQHPEYGCSPARGSINYSDKGQFCGGKSTQKNNGGKCSACGDNWKAAYPRPHDYGGKFAELITPTRVYLKGQNITAKFYISAAHQGYAYFLLCNKNEASEGNDVLTKCFNDPEQSIRLYTTKGETKTPIDKRKVYKVSLKLPDDLTCEDGCSMQWVYRAGNSWGCDAQGVCGSGKGPQEHFVNCADIMIVDCKTYKEMKSRASELWCGLGPTPQLKNCNVEVNPGSQSPSEEGNTDNTPTSSNCSGSDNTNSNTLPTCHQCTTEYRTTCSNPCCRKISTKTVFASKSHVPDSCCATFCNQTPSLCPESLCKKQIQNIWDDTCNGKRGLITDQKKDLKTDLITVLRELITYERESDNSKQEDDEE